MSRELSEIKKLMTDDFMANPTNIERYQLESGDTFDGVFSLVSLENIIFSLVAFAIWLHEKISVANAANSRPQNLENLKKEILNFHDGLDLVYINGAYAYDLTGVDDAEARRVVKRCAILESNDGELVVKVATIIGGVLQPLPDPVLTRLAAYIRQIKVPGVRVRLVNRVPDQLKATITAYINPLVIDIDTGKLLDTDADIFPVKDAFQSYLAKLEFNGAFVKDYLRTEIKDPQRIPLVTIDVLQSKFDDFAFTDVGEFRVPEAGYFTIADAELTIIYQSYAVVNY